MKKLSIICLAIASPVVLLASDSVAVEEVVNVLPGWLDTIIAIGGFGTIIRIIGAVSPGFGARLAAAVAKLLSPRLGLLIDMLRVTWSNSQPGSEQGIEWSRKEDEDFWTAMRAFSAYKKK